MLARVPVSVHTVHGPYQASTRVRCRAQAPLRHWLERRMARRFCRVVAVSDSIREHSDVVGIEPAGRRPCTTDCRAGPRSTPDGEGPTFLTVGRLDAIKNQAIMIRAFARVVAHCPDSTLLLVGDGPERPAMESLIAGLNWGRTSNLQASGRMWPSCWGAPTFS